MNHIQQQQLSILFNLPNCISWARLALLLLAIAASSHSLLLTFLLHTTNLCLDYAGAPVPLD